MSLLHVDAFLELLPRLKNKWIVLGHVSRRTGVRRAKRILQKKLSEEQVANILFLMDFEGAQDAGDIEDAGPPLGDGGE